MKLHGDITSRWNFANPSFTVYLPANRHFGQVSNFRRIGIRFGEVIQTKDLKLFDKRLHGHHQLTGLWPLPIFLRCKGVVLPLPIFFDFEAIVTLRCHETGWSKPHGS